MVSGENRPYKQRSKICADPRMICTSLRRRLHYTAIAMRKFEMSDDSQIDQSTRTEIEAAVFRRLVEHLRSHTEVQNIDLMNLASFCRNCLSKWYRAAASERGLEIDYEQAREIVYGMPYAHWKDRYQREASAEQQQAFIDAQQRLAAEESS